MDIRYCLILHEVFLLSISGLTSVCRFVIFRLNVYLYDLEYIFCRSDILFFFFALQLTYYAKLYTYEHTLPNPYHLKDPINSLQSCFCICCNVFIL
jgi:hypothetical protein